MGRSILGRLGFVDKGNYDNAYTYSKNDFVSDGISTYFSRQNNNLGHALTETDWWKCMAKGQAVTGAALLSELLNVDGSGSKLDADMLDGHHWTEITEPSEVADFDFFLGVKSLGEGKGYGIQKMSKQTMASVLEGLLPVATPSSKGLSTNNLCVVDIPNPNNRVLKIAKSTNDTYFRTLILITVYFSGYFALVTLGLAHTTQNKNCCKIEEQLKGRINVKEDNAGNVYIYSNSVNNQQFCVTFAGSTLNRTDIGSVSTISKSEFDSISTTDVEQYA